MEWNNWLKIPTAEKSANTTGRINQKILAWKRDPEDTRIGFNNIDEKEHPTITKRNSNCKSMDKT